VQLVESGGAEPREALVPRAACATRDRRFESTVGGFPRERERRIGFCAREAREACREVVKAAADRVDDIGEKVRDRDAALELRLADVFLDGNVLRVIVPDIHLDLLVEDGWTKYSDDVAVQQRICSGPTPQEIWVMRRGTDRLPPLKALAAFEAAARHLSFKKAATELHVTAGAVSAQVKILEAHLGVTLFRRLTRALELTSEAQTLLPKVREGLASLQEAVSLLRVREESAALTVIAPPNFAARWLVPRLQGFTSMHPALELHVASRQSTIDGREIGEAPRIADAREDAPTVAIRFGSGHYPGSRVDEVFNVDYVPVCSPDLMKGEHGLGQPGDLRHHTLLHDDTVTEDSARPNWRDWLDAAGVRDVDGTRGPHFSDASLALEAAIEGLGVALAIKPLLAAEIGAGRLVVPFDLALPARWAYFLVAPDAVAGNPAVAAFRTWILAEAGNAREAGEAPSPR
jgi:LysR family glycine cleavage system transcriptional activator